MKFNLSFLVLLLLSSCAAFVEPHLSPMPKIPAQLGILGKSRADCLDISGLYYIKPMSYVLQDTGKVSETEGKRYSYIALFGLQHIDRKVKQGADNIFPSKKQILIEQNSTFIKIIIRHLKNEKLIVYTLNQHAGDYTCSGDLIVFREGGFRGGAEGTWINYKSYRAIGRLQNNNLIFYEQIAFPETIKHKYFIFQQ